MVPDDAQHLLAHALKLGFSATVETVGESATVQVCLTDGAVLTLSADAPAVRYLLAHLAEVSE